jgi:hypothetical protein
MEQSARAGRRLGSLAIGRLAGGGAAGRGDLIPMMEWLARADLKLAVAKKSNERAIRQRPAVEPLRPVALAPAPQARSPRYGYDPHLWFPQTRDQPLAS